jgi:hypothetical protein
MFIWPGNSVKAAMFEKFLLQTYPKKGGLSYTEFEFAELLAEKAKPKMTQPLPAQGRPTSTRVISQDGTNNGNPWMPYPILPYPESQHTGISMPPASPTSPLYAHVYTDHGEEVYTGFGFSQEPGSYPEVQLCSMYPSTSGARIVQA